MHLHHDMESFEDNFKRGLEGKNLGIPTGFRRLSRYVGLRRGVYYLIGGYTGSGKTTLVDDVFVLHPAKWYLDNRGKTDIDFKVLYFSMERKKDLKIAKWVARFIFMYHGIVMSIDDVLGWNQILDPARQALVDKEKMRVNELLENVIDLHEGPVNPTGVYHAIQDFASSRGREKEVEVVYRDGRKVMKKVWVPDNPSEIVMIVTDHIGLAKNEKRDGRTLTDKETLDKYSEYMRIARDYYNYTPVVLSQFNRDIANPTRLKHGDVEPMLEDFKGSGDSQEDAEVIISLFDPIRYKVADPSGYELDRTVDAHGRKKYRSMKILKNSYGSDDIRIGLAFQPEVGLFKEMPKRGDTTDETYNSIIDNTYFLPET